MHFLAKAKVNRTGFIPVLRFEKSWHESEGKIVDYNITGEIM